MKGAHLRRAASEPDIALFRHRPHELPGHNPARHCAPLFALAFALSAAAPVLFCSLACSVAAGCSLFICEFESTYSQIHLWRAVTAGPRKPRNGAGLHYHRPVE